jgi:hypothetical protein
MRDSGRLVRCARELGTWATIYLLASSLSVAAGQPATSPSPEPPRWMLGVWDREWIEQAGVKSNADVVEYFQSPSWAGDLRIPRDRPSFPRVQSLGDLGDAELRALLRQQGSIGRARVAGGVATWTRLIDFQPSTGTGDVRRVQRDGRFGMLEHAPDGSRTESWNKPVDDVGGPLLMIDIARAGRPDRALLVVGRRFLYARNRPRDLPPAASLEALARAEHADRRRLLEYLDCEVATGTIGKGAGRWKIERSTLPWREGAALDFAGSVRPSDVTVGTTVREDSGERWTVSINTFTEAQLNMLFGTN